MKGCACSELGCAREKEGEGWDGQVGEIWPDKL
jgi:hypothetical protein